MSTLCRVLEVSVSGYYDWLSREPSQHTREDGELAQEIHRLFYEYRQVYGSPRIQVELRARGLRCSRERTARLMREMNLVAKRKRNKPIGTRRAWPVLHPRHADRHERGPSAVMDNHAYLDLFFYLAQFCLDLLLPRLYGICIR